MTRREQQNTSGFTSDVPETGKEVKPIRSSIWDTNDSLTVTSTCQPFQAFGDTQICAVGGYVKPPTDITLTVSIGSTEREFALKEGLWNPVGAHDSGCGSVINGKLQTSASTSVETVGITVSQLDSDIFTQDIVYDNGDTVYDVFETRTYGCVPYIYYLDHYTSRKEDGSWLMAKSCNRCGRYLPVEKEPEKESESASFSNHSRMTTIECVAGSFNGEKAELSEGYQLECKACKKFYVNASLNHKRSTAQRREDSTRRREIESIVKQYTNSQNVFKTFREEHGEELDEHILAEFGHSCFKCDKQLDTTEDMHLDHTMPLSYLWPLDERATALCPSCNSKKSDKFPVEFYSSTELEQLSEITGFSIEQLRSKECNPAVVESLPPLNQMDISEVTRKSISKRLSG